jgi:hypothetical protein
MEERYHLERQYPYEFAMSDYDWALWEVMHWLDGDLTNMWLTFKQLKALAIDHLYVLGMHKER